MISKSDEERYGFSYFDSPLQIIGTQDQQDEPDEDEDADEFDVLSCEGDCCDVDCECDDCLRCANRYRGLGDDEDARYSQYHAAAA